MPRVYTRRPLAERFWEKVDKGDGSGCWVWTAGTSNGYGRIRRGGRNDGHPHTHHVSWEMHYGPVPVGLWVLHRCDNPPCVRPDHLFLGTAGDNNRDRASKHRGAYGEDHPWHRLTEDQVIALRARYTAGESSTRLARVYGVTTSSVKAILHDEVWRGIGAPVTVRSFLRLTEADRVAIRAARENGARVSDIARRWGIDHGHASRVSRGISQRRAA